ncbi:MAG: glycosyltransferase family 1 protein [Verrucomicrobiota bacterium]
MPQQLERVVLIGNYAPDKQWSMLNFAEQLRSGLKANKIEVDLWQPQPVFNRLDSSLPGAISKWLGYIDKLILFPRRLKRAARTLPDNTVFHICDHSNGFYVPVIKNRPHLITCHDLMAILSARGEVPQHQTGFTGKKLQGYIFAGLTQAERIVCDSHSSRADLIRLIPTVESGSKVIWLPPPVLPDRLSNSEAQAILSARNFPADKPFILHVGSGAWYKNRIAILQAWQKFRETNDLPNLVFAGGDVTPEEHTFVQNHELESQFFSLTKLETKELTALYSLASVFCFPSHYEGFGLPPLEAQSAGCPVVASHGGSLAEVLEASIVQVDPLSSDSIFVALKQLIDSPEERAKLIETGHRNADRFRTYPLIDLYINEYREALTEHQKSTALN